MLSSECSLLLFQEGDKALSPESHITIFLCGDVMPGRGIDQILPHPAPPVLYEPYVSDARDYVRLAENVNGPIPAPVDFAYIWGDALEELRLAGPDARMINLETSITCNEEAWPGKGINYRMNPANIGCMTVARMDCCGLANNHVLDWGYRGLEDTLETLDKAHIAHPGAGRNAAEASAPAVLDITNKGRVLVFAFGAMNSGIPEEWAARENQPGVNLLSNLSRDTARATASEIRRFKRSGDIAAASIHWGGNWGYAIPAEQIDFAHTLVDEGVDIVHGHSSHHAKSIEVYRGRLILYGCGDFLNDYEGITGYEEFRSDLALMYLAKVDPLSGQITEARMIPFQSRRFRLERASAADTAWLCNLLNVLGSRFGTSVKLHDDRTLSLQWRL
jgi:poly-gamma-glutamate synthesis protein (capsule biosynthesis protein)